MRDARSCWGNGVCLVCRRWWGDPVPVLYYPKGVFGGGGIRFSEGQHDKGVRDDDHNLPWGKLCLDVRIVFLHQEARKVPPWRFSNCSWTWSHFEQLEAGTALRSLKQVTSWSLFQLYFLLCKSEFLFTRSSISMRGGKKKSTKIEDLRNRYISTWPTERNRFPAIYFWWFNFPLENKIRKSIGSGSEKSGYNQKSLIFLAPVFQSKTSLKNSIFPLQRREWLSCFLICTRKNESHMLQGCLCVYVY